MGWLQGSRDERACARSTGLALALLLSAGMAGCHLLPWARPRPDPIASVSGPAPYVEDCGLCHGPTVGAHYAQSVHAAKGIRCGQCHLPGGHPDFAAPVRDGKCGGCHQPEYQDVLVSAHYATRARLPLDADRVARKGLRAAGHRAEGRFVGDDGPGDLGGRLCMTCHYDGHRLGLDPVRRGDFCTGCHSDRGEHYAFEIPGLENRCIQCHVRLGHTVAGQIVNSHRFAAPSAGGKGAP